MLSLSLTSNKELRPLSVRVITRALSLELHDRIIGKS